MKKKTSSYRKRKTTAEAPKANPLAFLALYVGKYKNKKQHVGGGKGRDLNQLFGSWRDSSKRMKKLSQTT